MKKVARLRIAQDEQFVPPGIKINPEQTVRTTGRIKKPKAVFDPSDNYMPRSQRTSTQPALQATTPPAKLGSSVSTSPSTTATRRERSLSTGSNTSNTSISQNNDICIVCLKREPRRGGNYRNKLISCIECSKRVHRMCMNVDFFETAQVRTNFKCDNCRTCEICSSSAQLDGITCAKCCKSYHLKCHTPKIDKIYQTERHWKCYKCNPVNNSSALGSNKHSNSINNVNVMPVKIIRQIIGDNANLTNATQKALQTQSPRDPLQLPQQPAKLQHQQQKTQSKQSQQPMQLQEHVKISEAVAKTNILRKRIASATTSTSNSDVDESDEDSNDEDYEYVEQKKKPKTKNEHNNNHDIIGASDIKPESKQIVNVSVNSIIDLPKREIVRNWSVEQVDKYISKYFPNESRVFKDQEIDGNALLLLKRSDVVQKLPLKLGPSLRLYNLILKIQTQTANDPTLGWDCSVDTLLPSTE